MNERTVEVFDTKQWSQIDRVLLRMDDFDALADHLRRDGFRITVTNIADYFAMLGYLPTREPFYFGADRHGESSIQIGKAGDRPFVLVDGEYKDEDPESYMNKWSVWQISLDDDRQDWVEADEADKIFRGFIDSYKNGVPTMLDELYAPRARMIGGLVAGFIVDTLEQNSEV